MVLRWFREPNILAMILPSLLARMGSNGGKNGHGAPRWRRRFGSFLFVSVASLFLSSLSQTRPVTVVFSSFVPTVWSSHLPHLSVATLLVTKNLEWPSWNPQKEFSKNPLDSRTRAASIGLSMSRKAGVTLGRRVPDGLIKREPHVSQKELALS